MCVCVCVCVVVHQYMCLCTMYVCIAMCVCVCVCVCSYVCLCACVCVCSCVCVFVCADWTLIYGKHKGGRKYRIRTKWRTGSTTIKFTLEKKIVLQKRRLCVALQLLNMPSILFLDEPTSGLDASSSLELLTQLNRVAASNRAVILTIHQPRLEIFHLFHKIILLCQGKVSYSTYKII